MSTAVNIHRTLSKTKYRIFAGCAAMLALGLPLGTFFSFTLFVQYPRWLAREPRVSGDAEQRLCQYDPVMGYTLRPEAHYARNFKPGTGVSINRQGFRAGREYPKAAPAGRPRALCLGDSFTFGLWVDDAETFPAQLERLGGMETINLGLMGYGMDQACLRYRVEMDRYEYQRVILSIITDDFRRILIDRGAYGFFKPVYALKEGRLGLHNSPPPPGLPIGEYMFPSSRWHFLSNRYPLLRGLIPARLREDTPGLADDPEKSQPIAQQLALDLFRLCRAHNRDLLIVWMPSYQDQTLPDSIRLYQAHHAAFTAFIKKAGIPLLDLTEIFKGSGQQKFEAAFLPEPFHHPTPEGYRLFAEKTVEYLTQK
jgi:hypothetical protein